jgi:methionyl-tRNA formyltransferase
MVDQADKKLRVIYMGTPDFAVSPLQHIINQGYEVVAVYTQPPRPKGRGQQVTISPVHELAQKLNIPVYHPKTFRDNEEAIADFANQDADVAVVAAYGLILPLSVLEAPRLGCINIHGSLLPRWRGASPIQHAIWKGDDETGIGIMQMEQGLDTGPVILQRAVAIRPETSASSLHDELSALGAVMICEVLADMNAGKEIISVPQDHAHSTYAPMLRKEDGIIQWNNTAQEIAHQVRALNPWPGVWTKNFDGKRIKILEVEVQSEEIGAQPGTIMNSYADVACGHNTSLRLKIVQPENARPMDAMAAINGKHLNLDDVLG